MRMSEWRSDVCSSYRPARWSELVGGRGVRAIEQNRHRRVVGDAIDGKAIIDRPVRQPRPRFHDQRVGTAIGQGPGVEIADIERAVNFAAKGIEQAETRSVRCFAELLEVDEKRSEERRVGKECVSTCRSRGAAYH